MNEIDYEKLTHKAMLNLISDILSSVSEEGLPGEHHFYISFKTQAPKVSISDSLMAQYPDEMTIVLQNQFENLIVTPEGFSVRLRVLIIRHMISIFLLTHSQSSMTLPCHLA